MIFKIDLSSTRSPILPGKYFLKLYYTVQKGIFTAKPSTTHEYFINIHKDKVSFYPLYFNDPSKTNRRDCVYSVFNSEDLLYKNIFEACVKDSLMKPVSGNISLYLVDRQNVEYQFY